MILELPTELTVARAAELKVLLLSALDQGEALQLQTQAVSEVDAAGLQLLCAAHRTARARRVQLKLSGPRSAALAEAVATAGMGQGEDDRWLVEEAPRG